MKKLLLLVAAMVGFVTVSSAQSFDLGSQNITATVGFGDGYTPIALSYEKGIVSFADDHKLGLGGYIAICSVIAPAVECNYHFAGLEKFDLYGGVRLGYAFVTDGYFYNSFDIGCNYLLNDTWAINAEVGSGLGSLTLGAAYRF